MFEDVGFRLRIMSEWNKIPRYLAMGILERNRLAITQRLVDKKELMPCN